MHPDLLLRSGDVRVPGKVTLGIPATLGVPPIDQPSDIDFVSETEL
jgi:hypothetical protein